MNVNHDLKVIWWLPSRTGSRATVEILSVYNFWNEEIQVPVSTQYTHSIRIPAGCEDYTIICNIRNPYAKVLSTWHLRHFSQDPITGKVVIEVPFSEFLSNRMFHSSEEELILTQARKPDIYIRLESLPEDLKQVSFIDFDDPNMQGIMKYRINQNAFSADGYHNCNAPTKSEFELTRDSKTPRLTDYKSYYKTQNELDVVWEMYEQIFKEFGYQREFICQKT